MFALVHTRHAGTESNFVHASYACGLTSEGARCESIRSSTRFASIRYFLRAYRQARGASPGFQDLNSRIRPSQKDCLAPQEAQRNEKHLPSVSAKVVIRGDPAIPATAISV